MYRLFLILVFFTCRAAEVQSQVIGISGVTLNTMDGKKFFLNDFQNLSIVVFLAPGCPLSQKYTLALNELAAEFHDKVRFYGVFADTETAKDEYKSFQSKYGIQFPLLVDKKKKLVKTLAATVTPEAFVINKGKVVYHGAIDDWAIELGKTKKKATVNFVRTAVQCAMANIDPFPNYTKPVGCFIE